MRQETEFGSYAWILTHAVAIDTNKPSISYAKQNTAIVTDVFLMILCKAFSGARTTDAQQDSTD
ncbi:MAG: hypothetical protein KGI25_06785 [Thaumarchaeota archaeon]|nr:hypothetical protein [Nitrososphaerota archaeon]